MTGWLLAASLGWASQAAAHDVDVTVGLPSKVQAAQSFSFDGTQPTVCTSSLHRGHGRDVTIRSSVQPTTLADGRAGYTFVITWIDGATERVLAEPTMILPADGGPAEFEAGNRTAGGREYVGVHLVVRP
jgi:hypothetical protein